MVISQRKAYATFRASNSGQDFDRWGASQSLIHATNPLVRGTRSNGGGLIPLRNVLLFQS